MVQAPQPLSVRCLAPSSAPSGCSQYWPQQAGTFLATARLETADSPPLEFLGVSRHPLFVRVAGDRQAATVGEALPLPLKLRATWEGSPLAGEKVWWSGQEQPALTDAEGFASASVSAGIKAGDAVVSARLGDLLGPKVEFAYDVLPGPVASVEHLDEYFPGHWIDGSGFVFSLVATDAYNNPVPGVAVEWTVTTGSALLSASSEVTNDNGWATVLVTGAPGFTGDIALQGTAGGIVVSSREVAHADFLFANPTGFGDVLVTSDAMTASSGATVRWANWGDDRHGLHTDGDSEIHLLSHGEAFEQQFTSPGVYLWRCTVHSYETFTITVTP